MPGAGVPLVCPARTDCEYFALLVDQYLDKVHIGEPVQARRIDIKFIVVKCHRGLIDVGEKFPAHNLISVIIEPTGELQKIFAFPWRWHTFLFTYSICRFWHRIRQLGL